MVGWSNRGGNRVVHGRNKDGECRSILEKFSPKGRIGIGRKLERDERLVDTMPERIEVPSEKLYSEGQISSFLLLPPFSD